MKLASCSCQSREKKKTNLFGNFPPATLTSFHMRLQSSPARYMHVSRNDNVIRRPASVLPLRVEPRSFVSLSLSLSSQSQSRHHRVSGVAKYRHSVPRCPGRRKPPTRSGLPIAFQTQAQQHHHPSRHSPPSPPPSPPSSQSCNSPHINTYLPCTSKTHKHAYVC